MKHLLLVGMLSCSLRAVTFGQDGDLETHYFNKRSQIKTAKIREATERVSQYWKNQCIQDSAEIRYKYEFNTNGDLTRVDRFSSGKHWTTTNYSRNGRGDFTHKSYIWYDSVGDVRSLDWVFEFNRKGLRVLEILFSGKDTVRINKLRYDKKGNLIEKVANGYWLWKFKYDKSGNIVETEDCTVLADSIRCATLTKYHYEGDLLQRREVLNPGGIKRTEFDYIYDSTKTLVTMKEQRHVKIQFGTEAKKDATNVYVTRYEFDGNGNCVLESEFRKNETNPFRCTYHDYKYYGRSD
jgi:YD repeat-containing protein